MPFRLPRLQSSKSRQHDRTHLLLPVSFLTRDFLLPWPVRSAARWTRSYASTSARLADREGDETKTREKNNESEHFAELEGDSAPPTDSVVDGSWDDRFTRSSIRQTAWSKIHRSPPSPSQSRPQRLPSTARRKPIYTPINPKLSDSSSTSLPLTVPTPTEENLRTPSSTLEPLRVPNLIHHHLQRYNPSTPSTLLRHLQARPDLLTQDVGRALIGYSRRWTEPQTEYLVSKMMGQKRIGSLSWIKPNRSTSEADVNRRYSRPPNVRAMKAWPPISSLSPGYTESELLRHLHHVFLTASPDYPIATLEDALAALVKCENPESGERDGVAREVLHLFLAYPTLDWDAQETIEIFFRCRPAARLSRQTLHLVLLSILWPPEQATEPVPVKPVNPEDDIQLNSSSILRIPSPAEPVEVSPDVGPPHPLKFIDTFHSRYDIKPSLETYRHLGRWAIQQRDLKTAEIAWKGWWAEHRRLRDCIQREDEVRAARRVALQSGESSLHQRSAELVTGSGIEITKVVPERRAPPVARFRHLGQQYLRWRDQVVRKFRDKGWVERVIYEEVLEEEKREAGWVWRGIEGEEAEKKRKHERWKLREASRRDVDLPREGEW